MGNKIEECIDMIQFISIHNLKNAEIKDGKINVDGDVDLYRSLSGNCLPVQFGKVAGNFNIGCNNLTSLKGCPEYVGGNFYCFNNQLETLVDAPKFVGGNFNCRHNKKNFIRKDDLSEDCIINGMFYGYMFTSDNGVQQ